MIYLSKTQLKQVEYLIDQSIQGNHVLFDTDTIRRVFERGVAPSSGEDADTYEVEPFIERLLLKTSLEEKRAFLDKLDPSLRDRVVQTYFNIVENNLFETSGARH